MYKEEEFEIYTCDDCSTKTSPLIFKVDRYLGSNPFCPCCGEDEYTHSYDKD